MYENIRVLPPPPIQYFWGFQKNEYFWGYEDIVDILGGSLHYWTNLGGHFYTFSMLFLKAKYRM